MINIINAKREPGLPPLTAELGIKTKGPLLQFRTRGPAALPNTSEMQVRPCLTEPLTEHLHLDELSICGGVGVWLRVRAPSCDG